MTTTLKSLDGLQGRALPEDAPVRDALVRAHDPECDANSNAASGGFVGAPLVGRPSVGVDLVGEASVRLQAERQGGVVKERHALHLSGTLRAFRFLLGPDDEEPGAAQAHVDDGCLRVQVEGLIGVGADAVLAGAVELKRMRRRGRQRLK